MQRLFKSCILGTAGDVFCIHNEKRESIRTPCSKLFLSFNFCGFACSLTHIVEFCSSDIAFLRLRSFRSSVNEAGSFFYATPEENLPDGKSFADTAVLSLENESLKNLDPFSVAFFDFDVDPDSVATPKAGISSFLYSSVIDLKYPFVSSFPPRRSWRNHFQRTARNNFIV